ncbi:MAG: hypothetical protein MJE77_10495 [Proteobacteria bacterium]|nr:hypothetical protein [Pseudomonadota bacterium]
MNGERNDALAIRSAAPAATPAKVRFKTASSLDSADIGDIILIDDRGEVIGPGQLRRMRWLFNLKLGAATGAFAVIPAVIFGSAWLGWLAAFGYLGVRSWRARPAYAVRRGVALVAAREYSAAEKLFRQMESRELEFHHQRIVDVYMAKIAWRFGRFDEANDRYQRAMSALSRNKHGEAGMYWLCAFDRVQLTCARGDVERAVQLRRKMIDAPKGEYFQFERLFTDLLIGFHQGTSKEVEDDLYDAVKITLQSNCFGRSLVLLSWAFHDRGDDEMAVVTLSQAPSRLTRDSFADAIPRLHDWMMDKCAEWGVDL